MNIAVSRPSVAQDDRIAWIELSSIALPLAECLYQTGRGLDSASASALPVGSFKKAAIGKRA